MVNDDHERDADPDSVADSTPAADSDSDPDRSLSDAEVEALHEVELGVEWLHRAHGHLVQFHHATGHAMDHLATAEEQLREAGYQALADRLRDDLLPHGVVGDTWSYSVLESFQDGPLAAAKSFGRDARDRLADGRRHVAERRQEREWTERARE